MIEVKIINESGNPTPQYATSGSAGMDLRAWLPDGNIVLKPFERKLIPTGLRLAVPSGYECQIRPRSGLALNHGVTVLNTPGTIDSDYRGYVGVILINLSSEPYTVRDGERICQMVFAKVETATTMEVEFLDTTCRGEGGFGHTGIL